MTTPTAAEALELQRATGQALLAALDAGVITLAERPLAARLAAIIRNGRDVTSDDARAAWRLLTRHAAALDRAGIAVPGRDAPPPQPQPRIGVDRPELAIRSNARAGNPYNRHIVVSHAPYAARDVLKAVAFAQWDEANKWWHTPATPAHAGALMRALADFDPLPSPRVATLADEFASLAARRAVLHPEHPEPDFPTSHLVTSPLWGHQLRALEFSASSTASLMAIPMGGGKTAATIALANQVQARRVVIVCPNKVRGVWPREVAKWSERSWHVVDGTRSARRKGGRRQNLTVPERLAQAEQCLFDCGCGAAVHAAVFNYEMLVHSPFDRWHPAQPIDLAIYDEVHRVKSNKSTGMSANLARWVDFTERRVGLSGTPMPQVPWDIFGVYRALDPGIFGRFWTPFKGEYVKMATREADNQSFPVAILPEKRRAFSERVHSIMYRPTIDLHLPPVTHFIETVELEPDARREYDRLAEKLWADLTEFEATAETAGVTDVEDQVALTPKNVLSRLLRLMQFTGGTVPSDEGDKRRVSRAKADALMEFDHGAPAGGILYRVGCYPKHPGGVEPVCVYAQFRDDLDAIREVAEKAGLRYREISGRRADGLTDTSEMTPDADVVGIQIQSGGTGVDLTRSCVGVWYSKGHSNGDYEQALKRQDRPGQTRPVTFVHIEAQDTVDHDVYRSLMGRRAVVAGVLAIHGVSAPGLGGDGEEAPEDFDTVFGHADGQRHASGVYLPIDDYDLDVLGDPRPPERPLPTAQDLADFDLEDVLG